MRKELKELFGLLAGAFIFGELLLNTVFREMKAEAQAPAPSQPQPAPTIGIGAPAPSPIIQPTAQPQLVSLAETQSKIEQMIKQGATSEALQTYLQTVSKLVTGEATAPVGTGIGVAFPAGTPEAQTLAQLAQKEQTLVSQGLTVSGAQTVVYGGKPVTLYRVYSKDGVLIAKFDTTQSNWQEVLAAYQQSVNQFGGRIEATTFS